MGYHYKHNPSPASCPDNAPISYMDIQFEFQESMIILMYRIGVCKISFPIQCSTLIAHIYLLSNRTNYNSPTQYEDEIGKHMQPLL